MRFFKKKKKYQEYDINPNEILIDTMNVSQLDQQQFEGVIEKKISSRALLILIGFVIFIVMIFITQLIRIQLVKGSEYRTRSESNRFREEPIFAERGIIYDRNNVELAWNVSDSALPFLTRSYILEPGYGHLIHINYSSI